MICVSKHDGIYMYVPGFLQHFAELFVLGPIFFLLLLPNVADDLASSAQFHVPNLGRD